MQSQSWTWTGRLPSAGRGRVCNGWGSLHAQPFSCSDSGFGPAGSSLLGFYLHSQNAEGNFLQWQNSGTHTHTQILNSMFLLKPRAYILIAARFMSQNWTNLVFAIYTRSTQLPVISGCWHFKRLLIQYLKGIKNLQRKAAVRQEGLKTSKQCLL